MEESREQKFDAVNEPAASKDGHPHTKSDQAWASFDSSSDDSAHGPGSLDGERPIETPPQARPFGKHAAEPPSYESQLDQSQGASLQDPLTRREDSVEDASSHERLLQTLSSPFSDEIQEEHIGNYASPYPTLADYPEGEPKRRRGRGKIFFWGASATFLVVVGLILFFFWHSPSPPPPPSPPPDQQPEGPASLQPVMPRAEQILTKLSWDYNTLVLIHPKHLDVQSIESALKIERDRRMEKGGPRFTISEQDELISSLLFRQVLVVTKRHVDAEIEKIEDSSRRAGNLGFSADKRQEQRDQLVERLIETAVIGLEGLKTFPGAMEEAKNRCDRVRAGLEDEPAFDRWARYEYGSEEAFRRWVAVQVAAEKYRIELESRARKVPEDKIRSYYQNNLIFYEEPEKAKVAQIFIRMPMGAAESEQAAKEALINRINDQLRTGGSFEALAARYSEDGNTGREYGLGAMERDELAPELSAAIFNLKPKDISPVIRTKMGFHILKLISKNSQHTLSYDEVRDEIHSRLGDEQVGRLMPTYIAELKKDLEIKKR